MGGQKEINELHVPAGRAVKLTMGSEDVLHSFYIPAFRVKADVIPGRYNVLWFTPTKPGRYHLFCAEYCGTKHSGMIGWVYAMEPNQFQAWLGGGNTSETPAAAGEKLFQDFACSSCHRDDALARAPQLKGLFGKNVELQGGATVVADESYIRESIVQPQAKIVNGFPPIMPTFQGLISEEQLLQLIAYVRSLGEAAPGTAAPAGGATSGAPGKD
jgi:cytochrome c oxidase subunit 2